LSSNSPMQVTVVRRDSRRKMSTSRLPLAHSTQPMANNEKRYIRRQNWTIEHLFPTYGLLDRFRQFFFSIFRPAIGAGEENCGKLLVSIFFSSLENDLNSIERAMCYKWEKKNDFV
jgi:hypothetical protein